MKFEPNYPNGLNFEYNFEKREYKLENNTLFIKKNPIIKFHEFINLSLYNSNNNNYETQKITLENLQRMKEELIETISEKYKNPKEKGNVLKIINKIKKENDKNKYKKNIIDISLFNKEKIEIDTPRIEIPKEKLDQLINQKYSDNFDFCVICGSKNHLLCDTDYNLKNGKIYISLNEENYNKKSKLQFTESKLIKNTMFYDSEEDEEIL